MFTLTKPSKFQDAQKWIVYILKDGKYYVPDGNAGHGNTPENATKDAVKLAKKMGIKLNE